MITLKFYAMSSKGERSSKCNHILIPITHNILLTLWLDHATSIFFILSCCWSYQHCSISSLLSPYQTSTVQLHSLLSLYDFLPSLNIHSFHRLFRWSIQNEVANCWNTVHWKHLWMYASIDVCLSSFPLLFSQ